MDLETFRKNCKDIANNTKRKMDTDGYGVCDNCDKKIYLVESPPCDLNDKRYCYDCHECVQCVTCHICLGPIYCLTKEDLLMADDGLLTCKNC